MNKNLPLIATLFAASLVGIIIAKKDGTNSADIAKKELAQALISAKTDNSRAKGTARPWAQSKSDIKADANTIYGTLENGMRYVIHRNTLPPKRVSLRLHVDAGSLSESESQRGVAHFLEHMVFNGTKSFPDATKLIPQMQRLGIAFGAHANAYTSFDKTVYMLDLPDMKDTTMELSYNVMGDFADGALLTNAEIDEERGVISSEKTSRDSIQMRMVEKQFKRLMPNSLVPERFPIGLDKVIAEAPRKEFVDFYTKFYTPEKMTFIIVGDVDVAATEQKIQDIFGSIKNPVTPGKTGSVGDLSGKKGFQTAVFTDKELSSTYISLVQIQKEEKQFDTVAHRAEKIPLNIAHSIINRRFSRLAKQEGSVITSGSIDSSNLFREAMMVYVNVTAKDGNWQATVPVLEQELRRAMEHGFTQAELNEITASMINNYEQNVETAATRKNKTIANSLVQHIHGDFVYSTAEDNLSILMTNLAKITPETCHKAFKNFWSTDDLTLMLSVPEAPEAAEEALAALYKRSTLNKVTPLAEEKVDAFAYTDFGDAGKATSSKHIKDLDIHQIQFANGVRVNYKKTDFDKNAIIMSANLGSGKVGMPQDKPGLNMLAGSVMNDGGLGKHSLDDLRTLLAGKNVYLSFSISDESFTLSGKTTPEDLELQLQILCATLTDPGYRPEAERQFKGQLPMLFSQLKHSAQGAQAEMNYWLHGNDPRFDVPNLDQAKSLTTDDVRAWIQPQLDSAALEIGIVGDIDPATLIPLLEKTVGALKQRDAAVKIDDSLREIKIPATPVVKDFNFESKVPTAIAIIGWKAQDNTDHNAKRSRRTSILAEVLGDRMRIKLREELGEAYSPRAHSKISDTYKNVGFIMAYSPVKPKDLENVSKVIVELGDKLAKEGLTQDELDRALTPRIGMLSKSIRQNSYWLGNVVAQSQTRPDILDWSRGRDADYKAITLAEINALAKKYLSQDRSLTMKIQPAKEQK